MNFCKPLIGGTCANLNISTVLDYTGLSTDVLPDTLIPSEMEHNVNGILKYTSVYLSGGNCYNFPIPMVQIWRLNANQDSSRYVKWDFRFNHM